MACDLYESVEYYPLLDWNDFRSGYMFIKMN